MTAPLSAVVVTYNSAHCVGQCLRSLREVVEPAEIVVVDNASADGSADAVRRAAPDALVLEPGANLGFGRAVNLAVEQAASPYVMLVNPDVVFMCADRAALARDLAHDPFGLLVPLLVSHGRPAQHFVYPYRSWKRWVFEEAWIYMKPRELGRRATLAPPGEDGWPAATVLIVRRDEFRSVGGFDARYFLYAEDVDLARRYRAHGLPLRRTDALTAEHAGASSSASDDDTKPIPHAWSILGTLEYVSTWEGERAAARAAWFVLHSLRLQRALLRTLPGPRFARKRAQIEAIEAFLVAHARDDEVDGSYCAGARVLLRSLI